MRKRAQKRERSEILVSTVSHILDFRDASRFYSCKTTIVAEDMRISKGITHLQQPMITSPNCRYIVTRGADPDVFRI